MRKQPQSPADRPKRKSPSLKDPSVTGHIDPLDERHNGRIYVFSYALIYLAAPVVYVGVVQAALCDKLGAGATVANLPASAYFLGFLAPVVLSSILPGRHEKRAVVGANLITSSTLAFVSFALFFPFDNFVRLSAVIAQGLVLGFADSVSIVYLFQCLNRGTTFQGRARALKFTYTFGPLFAVAGSLLTQYILAVGIPGLVFPRDFALIYLAASLCMGGVAFLASRYRLPPAEDKVRLPLLPSMRRNIASFVRTRTHVLLWAAFFLFFCTLNAMPNLSLFTREALGREPGDFSGIIMALRFGFKAAAGFLLGVILARWGARAPVLATTLLVGLAMLWAWKVPGLAYLFAFGFMGAGELGGAYFPNYVVTISATAAGARNIAILTLVIPASSLAPALHGALTDLFGFRASFALGGLTAAAALLLAYRLPRLSPGKGGKPTQIKGIADSA